MIRIKICGITRLDDAITAADAGADAVGFVFYPQSPRYIKPDIAMHIIRNLSPFIAKIGVFVNAAARQINELSAFCGLTHIQLHGDEEQEIMKQLTQPVIRALPFNSDLVKTASEWRERGAAIMVDSGNRQQRGGSGLTLPWPELGRIPSLAPFILAGGLSPDNILQAIQQAKPVAVDVSSGVEEQPGIKDKAKVQKFIQLVKEKL